jgi:2'-5' RNA ligase
VSESGFIVVLPEAEPYVGALRAAHDPSAAAGVPAHVTLLYPFRPADAVDAAAHARVADIAARAAAFDVVLARIERFPDTLFLAPEPAAPLLALTHALAAAFPSHPPYGGRHADVVPHLTVAQGDGATLDAAEATLRAALPSGGIAARCAHVVLMANDTGRWRRVAAWQLEGTRRRIATG